MPKNSTSLHIKIYKSNFFLIVSNNIGRVLFKSSSGNLGFKNIQKRGIEALISLLEVSLKKILLLKKQDFFLKLDGVKLSEAKPIYKYMVVFCKKNNIKWIAFHQVNKIAHNGCRLKK